MQDYNFRFPVVGGLLSEEWGVFAYGRPTTVLGPQVHFLDCHWLLSENLTMPSVDEWQFHEMMEEYNTQSTG